MVAFVFDHSVGFVANKAASLYRSELLREFDQAGLGVTPEHWAVLNVLWKNDGLIQAEIARRLGKDKANVTHILDVMERNQLVRRARNAGDRRTYQILLTSRGRALESELPELAVRVNERSTQGLSESERSEVVRLLQVICNNLE